MHARVSRWIENSEGWIRARRRWVALVIVLASLALRLGVFLELDGGPCLVQHRWAESDMHFFDRWSKDLAAGDWLNRKAPHPVLGWHRAIAERFFREYPDDALTRGVSQAPDPAAALWNEWYGPRVYHQEPLYPYAVALTYALATPDPRVVFAWQMLLGVLTNLLVWRIATRTLGELGGLSSAGLIVLCAPLLFYEVLLLRTALIAFESALLVWLALRCFERRSLRSWCALGAVFGLALLTNSTCALFAPLLALAFAWRERRALRPALGRLAACAGCALVVLSPVFARNAIVGAPLTATSSVGALAFICSNTGDYDPGAGFSADSRYLTRILEESHNRLFDAIGPTLATHASSAGYLRQVGQKLAWAWSWYEMPNNENLYAFQRFSRVLRWMPVGFGLIAPLALAGLLLGLRRFQTLAPLYAMALAGLVPLLCFYVLSRFRAPSIALLIPFAVLALLELLRAWSARAWPRLALIALVVLGLALWTNQPLPGGMARIRMADWSVPFLTWYVPEAEKAADAGDWKRVVELLDEGFEHEPPFLARIGSRADQRTPLPEESEWVAFSVQSHEKMADALEQLGDGPAALPHRARAGELQAALK